MSFGDDTLDPSDPPVIMLKKQAAPRAYVEPFHRKIGFPVREVPEIPPDDEMRFRLKFMWEEFRETMEAAYSGNAFVRMMLEGMETPMRQVIDQPLSIDMVKFIDGLTDQEYVNEGTRLYMGVNGDPIMKIVHRKNMEKEPGAIGNKAASVKAIKPEGWTPPDTLIAAELRRQGWGG